MAKPGHCKVVGFLLLHTPPRYYVGVSVRLEMYAILEATDPRDEVFKDLGKAARVFAQYAKSLGEVARIAGPSRNSVRVGGNPKPHNPEFGLDVEFQPRKTSKGWEGVLVVWSANAGPTKGMVTKLVAKALDILEAYGWERAFNVNHDHSDGAWSRIARKTKSRLLSLREL
jgi:hypothetical protein